MKKLIYLSITLLFVNNLYAQECIPDPTNFAKEIGTLIKNKNAVELKKQVATWKDIEPIYNYFQSKKVENNLDKKEMMRPIEESLQNIDTIINKLSIKKINLSNALVSNEKFEIDYNESKFPNGYYTAEGRLRFIFGDSAVKIRYNLIYLKKNWKVLIFDDYISIYYKDKSVYDNYDTEIPITVTDSATTEMVEADSDKENADTLLPEIPKFKNDEVQKIAQEYGDYLQMAYSSSLTGKEDKNEYLFQKAQEFAEKIQKVTTLLAQSPDEVEKWTNYITKLSNYYYKIYNNRLNKDVKQPKNATNNE